MAWFIATELKLPQYELGITRAAIDGRTLLSLAADTDELHLGAHQMVLVHPPWLMTAPMVAVLKMDVGVTIVPHRRTIIAAAQVRVSWG